MTLQKRWLVRITLAIVVVSGLVLIGIGNALGDIEVDGRSYRDKVFLWVHWPASDTRELTDAISTWRLAEARVDAVAAVDVQGLLSRHVLIDTWLLTPAYCLLLWQLLLRSAVWQWLASGLAAAVFVVDELENVATLRFVANLSGDPAGLRLVQSLTLLKWGLIACAVVALGCGWLLSRRSSRRNA